MKTLRIENRVAIIGSVVSHEDSMRLIEAIRKRELTCIVISDQAGREIAIDPGDLLPLINKSHPLPIPSSVDKFKTIYEEMQRYDYNSTDAAQVLLTAADMSTITTATDPLLPPTREERLQDKPWLRKGRRKW